MSHLELNRPLSASEMSLARWMLEHGEPKAREFLEQLATTEVTPWRCPCGCGSINFQIKGRKPAPPGVHILGDFIFGPGNEPAGVFIFESAGLLSGIEVYGLAGDAPGELPREDALRPFAPSAGGSSSVASTWEGSPRGADNSTGRATAVSLGCATSAVGRSMAIA